MAITLPTIPSTWIAHSNVCIHSGFRPHCVVLHKVDGYMPYCVHTAYVTDDGVWSYERGDYFKDVETAMKRFDERKGFVS